MNMHTTVSVILIIGVTVYILFAFYSHNSNKVDDEITFNYISEFIDKSKSESDFELCKHLIESYFDRTKSDKLQSNLLEKLVRKMKIKTQL